MKLKFYKLHRDAPVPVFSTQGSACFDVSCYWPSPGEDFVPEIVAYTERNEARKLCTFKTEREWITIYSGWRVLIPTGLIFDIPYGYSVRLHPRSGQSLKMGLSLANCQGIIDHDYYHETFVMVQNISNVALQVFNQTRICQGELIQKVEYDLEETLQQPKQKTDRVGGLGSTDSLVAQ